MKDEDKDDAVGNVVPVFDTHIWVRRELRIIKILVPVRIMVVNVIP